jgi:hypothetical protein
MDNTEKVSKSRQWQERASRPIAARPQTKQEIEEFRRVLLQSYEIFDDPEAIEFEFRKITDENDEDRDDCLMLVYRMKCVVDGKPLKRDIFTSKIPIPPEIKMMAQQRKKDEGTALVKRNANRPPPPKQTVRVEEVTDDTKPGKVTEPEAQKPKLRKPVRRAAPKS